MRSRLALLAAALTVALVPAVRADKQAPPAPAAPKGFSVPRPKTFTLDNGMAVTLVHYGTVPKVSIRLAILTGNVNEAANQVWLADLVGDMLQEGTAARTASQIAEDVAKMGGALEVTVGENRTEIGGDVLSDSEVWHSYTIADRLIERMDIERSEAGSEQSASTAFAHR